VQLVTGVIVFVMHSHIRKTLSLRSVLSTDSMDSTDTFLNAHIPKCCCQIFCADEDEGSTLKLQGAF